MDNAYGFTRYCSNRTLNSKYDVVAEFVTLDPSIELDQQEFVMLDGCMEILQAARIYHTKGIGERQSVVEAVFQEAAPMNGKVRFDWRSLDHISSNDSCIGKDSPD